jgi:hypothetical protein
MVICKKNACLVKYSPMRPSQHLTPNQGECKTCPLESNVC